VIRFTDRFKQQARAAGFAAISDSPSCNSEMEAILDMTGRNEWKKVVGFRNIGSSKQKW
jgi:hypothetical protein